MSKTMKVSVPRMKSDGDTLQNRMKQLPAFVQELDGAMKRLGQCWDGPAWPEFHQQVDKDIQNMLDLYEWMKKYVESMSGCAEVLGNTEKQCYDILNRVKI